MRNAKRATWIVTGLGLFLLALAVIGTVDYFFNPKSLHGGEVIGAWIVGMLFFALSSLVRFFIEVEEEEKN